MWVYIETDGGKLYTVGFYGPADSEGHAPWESDSDHDERQEAARRVNYLNGGNGDPYNYVPVDDRREPDHRGPK